MFSYWVTRITDDLDKFSDVNVVWTEKVAKDFKFPTKNYIDKIEDKKIDYDPFY
jgi:hypothetical protein